ncbi:hypothetical protein PENPOL_c007G04623 [Penicillium polonicum]|uniref:Uncharacterized protein n=1 Tax=Penicillium polonicum TaxID=60169 RepID=A0A1V6NJJ7_PENPO|nr:hypothetical protein PENPOL_c007G04623 [Penicillium polonicum]
MQLRISEVPEVWRCHRTNWRDDATIAVVESYTSAPIAKAAFRTSLVAPRSFVQMPRTIDRQLFTHAGTYLDEQKTESALARANFPKEFKPACNARDY